MFWTNEAVQNSTTRIACIQLCFWLWFDVLLVGNWFKFTQRFIWLKKTIRKNYIGKVIIKIIIFLVVKHLIRLKWPFLLLTKCVTFVFFVKQVVFPTEEGKSKNMFLSLRIAICIMNIIPSTRLVFLTYTKSYKQNRLIKW